MGSAVTALVWLAGRQWQACTAGSWRGAGRRWRPGSPALLLSRAFSPASPAPTSSPLQPTRSRPPQLPAISCLVLLGLLFFLQCESTVCYMHQHHPPLLPARFCILFFLLWLFSAYFSYWCVASSLLYWHCKPAVSAGFATLCPLRMCC